MTSVFVDIILGDVGLCRALVLTLFSTTKTVVTRRGVIAKYASNLAMSTLLAAMGTFSHSFLAPSIFFVRESGHDQILRGFEAETSFEMPLRVKEIGFECYIQPPFPIEKVENNARPNTEDFLSGIP